MTDYSELLKLDLFLARCAYPASRAIGGTKIYIGNLPVTMNEPTLKEVFVRHCQVLQVIIKKGNAQGHFDKFCYGFVTVNHTEKQSMDIIARIMNQHPNWRLKIKDEGPQNPRNEKFTRPPTNFPPPPPTQQQFQPQTQQNMYHTMAQQMNPPPPPPPQMMPMQTSHQVHQMHQGHQTHQTHQAMQGHQSHYMHQGQGQQGHQGHQGHQSHQSHQGHQGHQMHHQGHGMGYHQPRMHQSYPVPQHAQNDKGEIYGEKKNRIMVRQLWLGGIPQMIDHNYMTQVMSEFGLVEATEIFPKFAFVKFKRAVDAAIAFQRAARIYDIFGQNSGFRISFSDPSRRKQIVGNHYQFERNSSLLPILFLGFPPITSANVQINNMLSICQKYGTITNYYLKKSTNPQMRSYILFTYDNLKSALKAKQQLCRRKDLLGEKRVQITLLLQEQSVTKGRDFTHTERNFAIQQGEKIKKPVTKPNYHNNSSASYNSGGYQPPLVPGNYHQGMMMPQTQTNINSGYSYTPSNQFPQPQTPGYNNMGYYYPPPYEQHPKQAEKPSSSTASDVFDILQSVYDDPAQDKKKGPQKKPNDKEENTNDIISKMLGKSVQSKKKNEDDVDQGEIHENDHGRDKQPNWSGFITWKGTRRTGVDAFANKQTDFSDHSINVSSLIDNDNVILKEKANIMVLEPTNSISQPVFNEYLKVFKKKTGISVGKNWLIYLIGKNSLSDQITPIKENQLLVVMEKASLAPQLKDKVLPCNDSYFE